MRILLAHNNFTIHGGAEVFYHEVGRVLESHGHDVAYFSVCEDGVDSKWKDYFPDSNDYKSGSMFKRVIAFPKMVYSFEAKKKTTQLIEDFKPDIVHAFATYVKLTPAIFDACKDAGVPVVVSFNDYKHICPNYKLYHHGHTCEECRGGAFYRAVINRCCHGSLVFSAASMIEAYVHDWINIYRKNVHTFLFASDFMALKTEEFWGKGSFRWRKLRNPFESTKFKASYSPNGPVLFFGRMIGEKGIDILIRAASMLPDVDFRIVGDGPDMESLKKLAVELELENIEFAGAKWGGEMDAELAASRFVVVPSIWYENFPYVINQSFAFGKPVVGSNMGGIPELVQHGRRGLIYESTDPEALAEAISELWNSSDKVEIMGRDVKAFSDSEFNDEVFYKMLEEIYDEVLS